MGYIIKIKLQTTIMQYPKMQTIVVHPINSIKHICCKVCSTSRKKLKYMIVDIDTTSDFSKYNTEQTVRYIRIWNTKL